MHSKFIITDYIKEYTTSSKNIDTFFDDMYACFYMEVFCNNLSVLFMDMYLLCRLFVTYDTKREDYAPSDQKNIIIYAGDFHSKLYRDFILFSKISTININSQIGEHGDEDNCLDMTGIHQPFFSS